MKKSLLLTLFLILMGVSSVFAAQPSGSLPVMYINTENNAPITSKEDYVKGTYYLDPKGAEGVEAFGTEAKPLALQIRGRGNFTWVGFDKKPYRLKLDKKAALFGEAKSKHWALLAHADDQRGFLRNAVGFQVSRLIGLPWTPSDHAVEVVLNGDYIGLYFLTETVRVDSSRVDVWDYDSAYEDYADANPGQTLPWNDIYATGGWLCELDNYDDPCQVQINSIDPYNYRPGGLMRITYDTPSDYITEQHKTWLKKEFETLDKMIVNGDRDKCEWANKIDITDLAKFYVVNQIMFNYESFAGSCKLWRNQGEDSKWHFGPVWDFGSAFQTDDVAHFFFEYGPYSNSWIRTMYKYPAFKEEVIKIYKELKESSLESIDGFIDNFVASIKAGAAADYERWGSKGYGNRDMEEQKAVVKRMFNRSVSWLNNQWLGEEFNEDVISPMTDIYLRGTINNWEPKDEYKFTKAEDGTYQLHLDKLSGEFKLAGPEWGIGNVDYGMYAPLVLEKEMTLDFKGTNIKLDASLGSEVEDVTLIINWGADEKKLLATTKGADINLDKFYTVYFRNNHADKWDKVNVFTYNPTLHGNWPGEPMELVKVNGEELWMHRFDKKHEEGAVCLLFNNGGSKGRNQTGDLELHNNHIYTIDGDTGEVVGDTSGIETIASEEDVVEFYNLQGIRVMNPESGIFICRKGNRVAKIRM